MIVKECKYCDGTRNGYAYGNDEPPICLTCGAEWNPVDVEYDDDYFDDDYFDDEKEREGTKLKLNLKEQEYQGIPLKLIDNNYDGYKAKRYTVNNTNQNFWIPNYYLEEDGTIKVGKNLDFIFRTKDGITKLGYAGIIKNLWTGKYERDED